MEVFQVSHCSVHLMHSGDKYRRDGKKAKGAEAYSRRQGEKRGGQKRVEIRAAVEKGEREEI